MDKKLFRYQDSRFSANARWLLLQWSRVVGIDQPLSCSLVEMCRMLGMTAQQVRPALSELKLLGYVTSNKIPSGRGRPASCFQVSVELRQALDKTKLPLTAHIEDIEELCRRAIVTRTKSSKDTSNLMSGEQRKHKLSPATHWLLAVLLSNAEAAGVVTGLSYGALVVLTGMTRERLKSQLSKLKSIGVISYHQPGVLRDQGNVRLRSVFFIDIAHPVMRGRDSVGLRVFLTSLHARENFNFLTGFYEAALVFSELSERQPEIAKQIEMMGLPEKDGASYEERKQAFDLGESYSRAYTDLLGRVKALLPSTKYLEPATQAFLRLRELDVGAIMEAHILSYVLFLLSSHWNELDENPIGAEIQPVIAAINADCYSLSASDHNREELQGALTQAIYSLAVNVAMRLQQHLKSIEARQADFDFASGIFLIKPFQLAGKDFFELNVCFKPSEGVSHLNDTFLTLEGFSLSLAGGLKPLPQAAQD